MAISSLFVACALGQDLGSRGDASAHDAGAQAPDTNVVGASDGDRDASDASIHDGGVRVDAGADASGPTGPGPLGALPSGYCCTSDDECRFRKCVDMGRGNKMCLDPCSASRPNMCKRLGFAFTCQPFDGGQRCLPPEQDFACLDPSTFVRGTAPTGTCCPDTGDATQAEHCEANLCLAIGTGPWFCTRRCDSSADCPSDHRCYLVADRKQCIPLSTPYTCTDP